MTEEVEEWGSDSGSVRDDDRALSEVFDDGREAVEDRVVRRFERQALEVTDFESGLGEAAVVGDVDPAVLERVQFDDDDGGRVVVFAEVESGEVAEADGAGVVGVATALCPDVQRLDAFLEGTFDDVRAEDLIVEAAEFAEAVLGELALGEARALFVEDGFRDARALIGGAIWHLRCATSRRRSLACPLEST